MVVYILKDSFLQMVIYYLIMKISKKDALMWFEFFAQLPEDEELLTHQQEIALATFAQIEAAVDARNLCRVKLYGRSVIKVK